MIIISDNIKYEMELKDLANILFCAREKIVMGSSLQIDTKAQRGGEVLAQFSEKMNESKKYMELSQKYDVLILLKKEDNLLSCNLIRSGREIFYSLSEIVFKEKLEYKKTLYTAITCNYEKTANKWGILTGIRPVKIVNELKMQQLSDVMISKILIDNYCLSSEKAELIQNISKVQEEMIQALKGNISIYISIPFCPSRCNYCSFFSLDLNTGKKYVRDYIDALDREISETLKFSYFQNKRITCIYVGGGTPSSLDADDMKYFFDMLHSHFSLSSISEYTFEAGRADTLDEEKLRIIRENGVSRISINPQSMNDETLKKIGRNHSSSDVKMIFAMAREIGFDDINMDLILGLADENISDMRKSLDEVIALNPESITIHCLAIKRASMINQNQLKTTNTEISEYMSEVIDKMYQNGYEPYYLYRQKNMLENGENIGFAKKGKHSLYNVAIMDEVQSIIGFGVGSSSKILYSEQNLIKRIPNYKDVSLYNKNIGELIARKRFELE